MTRTFPGNTFTGGRYEKADITDLHSYCRVMCAACCNEWVAVYPSGLDTMRLQCPECGCRKRTIIADVEEVYRDGD